jgi:MerR family transcriptional regulator, copper efflux regulator
MLIGELAEQVGLPIHTIRFYERQGLLPPEFATRAENNYRHYAPEAAQQLMLIKRGQAAGFTLAEMRDLIRVWQSGELTLEEKEAIVLQKIEDVEKKIAELQQMKAYLLAKLPLLHIDDTMQLARYGEQLEAAL